MKLVTIRIELKEDDPEPEAKLDEGESIVKRVVELGKLWETLEGTSSFTAFYSTSCMVGGAD